MAKFNLLGKRKPEDDLETKPILKKHKEIFEQKVAAVTKKKLFVDNLSPDTKMSHIIDFFENVGKVVRVQLILNLKGKLARCGFVEFASANEAEKALEEKNGESLRKRKILIERAKTAPYPPPKYCIDHKVWYEDSLRRESLPPIEDETPHDFVEEVLFVTNLSPQARIFDIIHFFKDVGKVVSVRLIVNHEGKQVGCGFVEFASANESKEALENMNGEYLHDHRIFLVVAKTAPYPPRPKYTLAEILCYEDYLRRGSLLIEEDVTVEGPDETPKPFVEAIAKRKKTLFVANLCKKTKPSHIINFFKDVGEVGHVRLIVDRKDRLVGYGFVEFASANEAKKALEKKKGEYLHDRKINLNVATIDPYPTPRSCIDHKVWNEDYLRRESLLTEEDEAVEGLDETPYFVEDFAVRRNTLYVANLQRNTRLSQIINFFEDVGEVVCVRLTVDHMSERLGCGFVEFASANKAKKALEKKIYLKPLNCRFIFLDAAEIVPYPLRAKYNLEEKLLYEDYLRRESLEDDLETKLKKQEVPLVDLFCGKKVTFSDDGDE